MTTITNIEKNVFEILKKPRPLGANKNDFGHALVIAGDKGMWGAAHLCGKAALMVGAGKVTVATYSEHASFIPIGCPELMSVGVSSPSIFKQLFERATVVVLGPGFSDYPWSQKIANYVLVHCQKPVVVDGGGLYYLNEKHTKSNWVLTPHEGEAARLLKTSEKAIQANREEAIKQLLQRFKCTAVLKGHNTLVGLEENISLCGYGNPNMATAGMGDALTGMIAGLMAQGYEAFLSAKIAVLWHALTGDELAKEAHIVHASNLLNHLIKLN